MVDPATATIGAAVVGAVGSAAGGILGGIGAKQQADAQAGALRYKAGVALMNRDINKANANFALESGDIKSMETGLKAGQDIAETKVHQAASGLDVTTGSNAAVRESQNTVAAFDQNVIRWDAAKTSWGFQAKAATDEAEANLDLMGADNASQAGTISQIGSFIGAGTSVASKWFEASSKGVGFGSSPGVGIFQNGFGAPPTWGY